MTYGSGTILPLTDMRPGLRQRLWGEPTTRRESPDETAIDVQPAPPTTAQPLAPRVLDTGHAIAHGTLACTTCMLFSAYIGFITLYVAAHQMMQNSSFADDKSLSDVVFHAMLLR